MLSTFRTLFAGANARAEDHLRDVYAIELIDQKIRETEAQVQAAKATLASLIQRTRSEQKLLDMLQGRIASLTERAKEALAAGRDELANEAATAIAEMENESLIRQNTIDRLESQATRLRASVEKGHRRVIDLKQGALQAKAIRREQKMQAGLHSTLQGISAADEAQDLINRVMGKDDPLEQAQILADINAGLDHSNLEDRMAGAGFGNATKVTAREVLDRLSK
ncbi:PspA/IM30 family protein [uncultured Tateyamaria sp.]|uniref:PspA/IM30 family protein n=1 Tax=uncultured Tateyamaria sp. TaxID=455651 RepID=UPI00261CE90F|nr:PspA/IM30 family protein [uncultured Tateyamaria sp.]